MTQTREFNAATVDEAVQKASTSLGISAEDLSYDVVDSGSDGFLGIGARDARIVVELQEGPIVPPEPEEAPEPEPSEPAEPADTEAPAHLDLSEILGDSSAEAEEAPVPEELLAEIENLVSTVVDAMGFESRVDVYDANGFIAVDVASDNTALFIGQKGETIDALQYLVNAAIYRKHPFAKRIVLDAEGYRQRRVEAIQGIAHRSARRAIRERRTVELPPMSPAERRVVHIYLKDNPQVTTASEGTGDNRRVRISPT